MKSICRLLKVHLPFLSLAFLIMSTTHAQNIELNISGIGSLEGRLLIGIFKDQESFRKELYYKQLIIPKSDVSEKSLTITLDMEPGVYGFTLLDDENSNGKMDFNFIGIPREGYGFAEYYHKGLTRPHFDLFKQEILKNKKYRFEIKIKYF